MNKKISIIILVLLMALAGTAYYFLHRPVDSAITGTGMIEITQADLTPKISGYLIERNFKEGDHVEKGQIIARISPVDLALQYNQAVAAYQAAQSKLDDLLAGSRRDEIRSYEAAMITRQESRDKAASDYERFQKLYQSGAVSILVLVFFRVALANADGAFKQAQAAYQVSILGTRSDAITTQKYLVEQAKSTMESAKSLLNDTELKSPISGRILSKNYEVGEFISAGAAIATIGDLSESWVKIYIPSTEIGNLTLGQPVEVRIDSHPNRVFQGTIKEIATQAEFTPRQTITSKERANLVFAVKIDLPNQDQIFKPGMPAEVRIP